MRLGSGILCYPSHSGRGRVGSGLSVGAPVAAQRFRIFGPSAPVAALSRTFYVFRTLRERLDEQEI